MKALTPKPLTLIALLLITCAWTACVKSKPVTPPPPVDSTQIVDLKKGLLLYLPFTGNFADSSGNNNPTTVVGNATLSTDPHGTAASAFSGTGNGEKLLVTNNGSIKFDSAFSLSLNFMEHEVFTRQTLCVMVRDLDATGLTFGLSNSTPGLSNLNDGVSYGTTGCNDVAVAGNLLDDTLSFVPQPETWYNVVLLFNRGKMQTYINGTLVSEKISPSKVTRICPNAQVIVGGWWHNDPASVNGKIDELRLYDRALNTNEITKLATGFPIKATPPDSSVADLKRGLLLYLPFSGNFADSSGNNNPTTVVANATLGTDPHGTASSAFSGTGNGEKLVVTNNGSIKFDSSFSLSLDFMEHEISTRQTMCVMLRDLDATGLTFGVSNSTPGLSNLNDGVSYGTTGCNDVAVAGNLLDDTLSFVPQPETWYNVVLLFNKGKMQTYINGTLISEKISPSKVTRVCPDAQVIVGGWWSGDPASINGKIDNVRLYNRAINSNEIALLAQYYQPTTNSVRRIGDR